MRRKPGDVVLQGYNNPNQCGICLTNAVFALIVSSELLMAEVKNMTNRDSEFIQRFMDDLKFDPYMEFLEPQKPVITPGDLLRTKFIPTSEGRFSEDTLYGLAGDYYLLRSYLQRMWVDWCDRPEPSEFIVEACYNEIQQQKAKYSQSEVWGLILRDLFHQKQLTEQHFALDVDKTAIYFNEINFLELYWTEAHVSLLDYKRLDRNFLNMMNLPVTQPLTNYIEQNNLIPKHISISFDTFLTKEIHPLTYKLFYECLEQLNNRPGYVHEFVCPGLEIVFDKRSEKLPLNFNRDDLRHNFKYKNGHLVYKVTGISFLSLSVEENHENVDLILKNNMDRNINWLDPEIRRCEANMFTNFMDYITNVKQRLDLAAFAQGMQQSLRLFLRNICAYQKETFAIPGPGTSRPCHYFSITRKNNKWIILNDDIVVDIGDDHSFWSVFKFEHVAGILLERVPPNKNERETFSYDLK
ncbi:hypothetical protein SNEBB_006110 [Seison nebaliae]|nr:hypothetical protein SNEBB_006110 [Seison nebaliae]